MRRAQLKFVLVWQDPSLPAAIAASAGFEPAPACCKLHSRERRLRAGARSPQAPFRERRLSAGAPVRPRLQAGAGHTHFPAAAGYSLLLPDKTELRAYAYGGCNPACNPAQSLSCCFEKGKTRLAAAMCDLQREFLSVALDRIDWADETFHLGAHRERADLVKDIARDGIAHPPTLRRRGERFQIVIGFYRLAAAQSLGWSEITAFVLAAQTPDEDCAKMILREVRAAREPDPLELARMFVLLRGDDRGAERTASICALLGIAPEPKNIRRVLAALELIPEFHPLLAAEKISGKLAGQLAALSKADQGAFARLLESTGAGVNLIREFFETLDDLSLRERRPFAAICAEPALHDILTNAELIPARRAEQARAYLRARRFPTLTEWERRFEEGVKAAQLPPGARLTHDPNFEAGRCKIEFEFRSSQELSAFAERIQALAENLELRRKLGVE